MKILHFEHRQVNENGIELFITAGNREEQNFLNDIIVMFDWLSEDDRMENDVEHRWHSIVQKHIKNQLFMSEHFQLWLTLSFNDYVEEMGKKLGDSLFYRYPKNTKYMMDDISFYGEDLSSQFITTTKIGSGVILGVQKGQILMAQFKNDEGVNMRWELVKYSIDHTFTYTHYDFNRGPFQSLKGVVDAFQEEIEAFNQNGLSEHLEECTLFSI